MDKELSERYSAAKKKWTDLQMQSIEAKREFDVVRGEVIRAELAETIKDGRLILPSTWKLKIENWQTYVITNDGFIVNITSIVPETGLKWTSGAQS